MTSNYNSEDFIIQALSSLVLPPGGSRWAELNFRLKISSSIFIQINVSTFKVLFDAVFTHSLQFKNLTYFWISNLFANRDLEFKFTVRYWHHYQYNVRFLTLLIDVTGTMYHRWYLFRGQNSSVLWKSSSDNGGNFKCDKSFWNDILRGFAWALRAVWVAITYWIVIIALGPMSYPPHNLCSS